MFKTETIRKYLITYIFFVHHICIKSHHLICLSNSMYNQQYNVQEPLKQ